MTLDEKHSQLVNEFAALNAKLDKFINGEVEDRISLSDGRIIKSVSGIAADLEQFRYIQKIINHRTFSDMLSDNSNIENGLLVRIWGEEANNGIWVKNANLSFTKISYSDIYDLKDFLPNPWNYAQLIKTKTQYTQDTNLISIELLSTDIGTNSTCFDSEFTIHLDQAGYRGSLHFAVNFHFVVGSTTEYNSSAVTKDISRLSLDADFDNLTLPDIMIDHSISGIVHTFKILISTFKSADGLTDFAGDLTMNLYRIEADKYTVL